MRNRALMVYVHVHVYVSSDGQIVTVGSLYTIVPGDSLFGLAGFSPLFHQPPPTSPLSPPDPPTYPHTHTIYPTPTPSPATHPPTFGVCVHFVVQQIVPRTRSYRGMIRGAHTRILCLCVSLIHDLDDAWCPLCLQLG